MPCVILFTGAGVGLTDRKQKSEVTSLLRIGYKKGVASIMSAPLHSLGSLTLEESGHRW